MTNRITYLNQEIAPRPNDSAGDIQLSPHAMDLQCWFTPEGRLAGKKESNGRYTSEYHYTFDPRGHLLKVSRDRAVEEEYAYNPAGQRTQCIWRHTGATARFDYDDAGRLIAAGDLSYDYHPDGALKTRTAANGRAALFKYNRDGMLVKVLFNHGQTKTIDYTYGNEGELTRPICKCINGAVAFEYAWHDMFRLAACRDYAIGLEFEFIYHKRRTPAGLIIREIPDHPRSVYVAAGGDYDYIAERILNRPLLCGYDQVGTPKIITDNEGELLKSLDYDSFGNLIEDTLPEIFLPLGFACGLTDFDTGLVHFGYREYDPFAGRFISPDPLGDTGGDHDLYDYCVDDPVSMSDPTGLNPRLFGAFLQALAENAMRAAAPGLAKRAALLISAGGLFIASSIAGGISRKAGHPNPGAAWDGVKEVLPMTGKVVDESIGAIADPIAAKVLPGSRRVPEGMQTTHKRR